MFDSTLSFTDNRLIHNDNRGDLFGTAGDIVAAMLLGLLVAGMSATIKSPESKAWERPTVIASSMPNSSYTDVYPAPYSHPGESRQDIVQALDAFMAHR